MSQLGSWIYMGKFIGVLVVFDMYVKFTGLLDILG